MTGFPSLADTFVRQPLERSTPATRCNDRDRLLLPDKSDCGHALLKNGAATQSPGRAFLRQQGSILRHSAFVAGSRGSAANRTRADELPCITH